MKHINRNSGKDATLLPAQEFSLKKLTSSFQVLIFSHLLTLDFKTVKHKNFEQACIFSSFLFPILLIADDLVLVFVQVCLAYCDCTFVIVLQIQSPQQHIVPSLPKHLIK